jgi:type IV pilus assembly protein PilC
MKFNYKSRNKEGKIENGSIDAHSKEDALVLLQKNKIFVVAIEDQKTKNTLFKKIEFNKRVSKKDLAVFFRQLSLMLESQVPVVKSLLSLADQIKKNNFKEAILKISGLVEEGIPLSEALSQYPQIFSSFHVNLVKSGEASGKISDALYRASDHLEKESDIIARVRQAMIYPVFVILILLAATAVIINQLMPKISDIISGTGANPPFFTVIILGFYEFLRNYWWILAFGLFIFLAVLIYYFNTKNGREKYDEMSLKIPIFGKFLKKVFLVRFCSNVSTLLVAGILINRALKITEDTVNNIIYKKIISDIEQKVSGGEKISLAMLKYQNYFPLFVIQMIKVGEETGKIDKVLQEVVNFYQKDIKRTVDIFSTLLEPIIIILLGIVITVLAISVLSSIYGAIGTL